MFRFINGSIYGISIIFYYLYFMTFTDFLGLILACGTAVLGYFLKRMVDALDRISDDISVIKTSIAVHEERHNNLEERVKNLEKK